jgi:hypothetical protein
MQCSIDKKQSQMKCNVAGFYLTKRRVAPVTKNFTMDIMATMNSIVPTFLNALAPTPEIPGTVDPNVLDQSRTDGDDANPSVLPGHATDGTTPSAHRSIKKRPVKAFRNIFRPERPLALRIKPTDSTRARQNRRQAEGGEPRRWRQGSNIHH